MSKTIDFGQVKGTDGKSAYQTAVEGGYAGTETAFNESMVALPNHVSDMQNPHGVTAAQIGAATPSYVDSAIQTAIQNSWEASY